jgi:hypothetical protein
VVVGGGAIGSLRLDGGLGASGGRRICGVSRLVLGLQKSAQKNDNDASNTKLFSHEKSLQPQNAARTIDWMLILSDLYSLFYPRPAF